MHSPHPARRSRRAPRPGNLLLLLLVLVLASITPPAQAGDFGTVSLWEVTGVTGPREAYENQLALSLMPAVRLGRVWSRAPKLLAPLRLMLDLGLAVELTGNDGRFHGASYASPLVPGGAETLALNELGAVTNVRSGQVEGTQQRALLTDLWLGLLHGSLYTIPRLGIDVGARLAFTFPTSAPSRNAGLLLSVTEGLALSRTLGKRLELTYGFRLVQHAFASSTSQGVALGGTVEINGRPEPLYTPLRATVLNPQYGFINVFAATLTILEKLSLYASYSLTNTLTYPLAPLSIPGLPAVDVCADGPALAAASGGRVVRCGDRAQRDTHWFQLRLEYQLLPALALNLGLSTLQPVRHEGASVSNPFLQTLPTANYTTIELGVYVDLEATAAAARRLVRR